MELLSKSHGICENFEWASAICNYKSFIKTRFYKFNAVNSVEMVSDNADSVLNHTSEVCGIETISFH
jgi:hypothetical protein